MRKAVLESYNKKMKIIKQLETILISVFIVSFLILLYCIYVSIDMEDINEKDISYSAEQLGATLEEKDENSGKKIEDIIETVNEGVVGISKIKNKGNTIFLENSSSTLELGTGFIISEDGYIVTNEHVSNEKYSNCYITLYNGNTYNGKVIWSDEEIDLSILKIEAKDLKYLELGDSDKLRIAQKVYAIGNPVGFEFQRTVTGGIISNLDRTVKIDQDEEEIYIEDLIQTDASINSGNSGGPLINEKGEVIGINSIKINAAEGIGFAIPINLIKPVIESIKKYENYKTAKLGIYAYDKNIIPYIKQDLGVTQNLESGIYVAKVIKNSAADKANINEGDIITKIDEIELIKMSDLRKYIYSKNIGDKIKIKYLRNNKENEVEILLN